MGAYDAIIKRANKIIDKASNKLHSARVHLVDDEADISKLQGLVIILNSATSKLPRISTQAKSQPHTEDFSKK